MSNLPDFSYETNLWQKGIKIIAGLDEVGRGSLAGPVCTGCVIFKSSFIVSGAEGEVIINDSKKLTSKQRELANIWIKEKCLAYAVGSASVAEINKFGIVKATNKAFRRAIKNCEVEIDFLLLDAFYVPNIRSLQKKRQLAIIKGDTKSISIAAASIVAKVHRDNLMVKLSSNPKYKKYKWNENKGYGTKFHKNAIKIHGITNLHRKDFVD